MEKQLFEMVYQWGRAGVVTDEKCNAFQDLLKEIKEKEKDRIKLEVMGLIKVSKTDWPALESLLKEL